MSRRWRSHSSVGVPPAAAGKGAFGESRGGSNTRLQAAWGWVEVVVFVVLICDRKICWRRSVMERDSFVIVPYKAGRNKGIHLGLLSTATSLKLSEFANS